MRPAACSSSALGETWTSFQSVSGTGKTRAREGSPLSRSAGSSTRAGAAAPPPAGSRRRASAIGRKPGWRSATSPAVSARTGHLGPASARQPHQLGPGKGEEPLIAIEQEGVAAGLALPRLGETLQVGRVEGPLAGEPSPHLLHSPLAGLLQLAGGLLRDLLPAIGVHDQRDAHEDQGEQRQEPDHSLPRQAPQPRPAAAGRGLPLSRRGRHRCFTSRRRFDLVQAVSFRGWHIPCVINIEHSANVIPCGRRRSYP